MVAQTGCTGPCQAVTVTTRMHEGQWDVDTELVRRLVATQFPQWAHLPVTAVSGSGTVNALFRLGPDKVVRMPLTAAYATDDHHLEERWLRWIAPQVPVAVPEYLGIGQPTDFFPATWSVCRWLPGEPADPEEIADPDGVAADIATFVGAVRSLDPTGWRLSPGRARLRASDAFIRDSLHQLADEPDAAALTAAWEDALALPDYDGDPVVIHGDLIPGNLLLQRRRLSAVIDWTATASDPAHDLIVAWYLLDREHRPAFREELGVDEPTWLRAWARALEKGLAALPYYRHTNPVMARHARHVLHEVAGHSPL